MERLEPEAQHVGARGEHPRLAAHRPVRAVAEGGRAQARPQEERPPHREATSGDRGRRAGERRRQPGRHSDQRRAEQADARRQQEGVDAEPRRRGHAGRVRGVLEVASANGSGRQREFE